MTEISPSPDIFLRKRKSNINEIENSFNENNNVINNVVMNSNESSDDWNNQKIQKRIRLNKDNSFQDMHNAGYDEHDNNNNECKRIKYNDFNSSQDNKTYNNINNRNNEFNMNSHLSNLNQMQQYYENTTSSIKKEYQSLINQKELTIKQLTNDHENLIQRMAIEHHQCLDENRILKKAVTIQDTRYKELNEQYSQLQQLTLLLEKNNHELRNELNNIKYNGYYNKGFDQPPPPDVF